MNATITVRPYKRCSVLGSINHLMKRNLLLPRENFIAAPGLNEANLIRMSGNSTHPSIAQTNYLAPRGIASVYCLVLLGIFLVLIALVRKK